MDLTFSTDSAILKIIVTAFVLVLTWIAVKKGRSRCMNIFLEPYYSITEYDHDVIYLFVFPRKWTRQLINLSPFAVKLESWLRLKKLPYKIVETNQFSKSTQQIPYIRYKGQEIADTSLIIDFLESTFDLKDDLDPEKEGISRAFTRMVDDGLSLTHFKFRYNFYVDKFYDVYYQVFEAGTWRNKLLSMLMKKGIIMNIRTGVGRHKPEVVGKVGQNDIRAISKYLGDKQFMFGDTIKLVDCAIFGQLSQIIYLDLNFPHKDVLQSECKNIIPYIDRIRSALWSDWDELVCMSPFNK